MNTLTVTRVRDTGIYLDGGERGEILLPPRDAPREVKVGDRLELFVYVDSDGTLLATPGKPLAQAGDVACLKVLSQTPHGAFLDWGIKKNLLVPYGEQAHVFTLEGHQWPLEPGRPDSDLLSSVQVGPLEAITITPLPGAGGSTALPGDYLYGDHRDLI